MLGGFGGLLGRLLGLSGGFRRVGVLRCPGGRN